METRVQPWGNSLAMRIPRAHARECGLEAGSPVDVAVVDGTLVVRPVRQGRASLRTLLRRIDSSNLHGAVATGRAVGREAW
jgi:antitoxin MazE